MGEDPGAIRAEIDATRTHMGETADALADKASAREQVKQRADIAKDMVSRATGTGTAGDLVGKARGYANNPEQLIGLAQQAASQAQRAQVAAKKNPTWAGAAGVIIVALATVRAQARRRKARRRTARS